MAEILRPIFEWLANNFDKPILDWIIANLQGNAFLDFFLPTITHLGDDGLFWIACAVVLLLIPKTRKIGLSMGVALVIGLLVCNLGLKLLCQRPRPYDFFADIVAYKTSGERDFSFPSGHTIASFEAAIVLLIKKWKIGIPATILAALIAFSRLFLCVHYPTDVLTSVVLGTGIAFLAVFLVNKLWAYVAEKIKAKKANA